MRRWATVALLFGLAASACSGGSDSQQALCGSADHILPSSTLEDLVTYADEVAVVTVTDDEAVRHDVPGDGLRPFLSRETTLRVDEVVWRAPSGRAVPDETTYTDHGWVDGDPAEGPAPVCDQPSLEVGRRYLVGMVEYPEGWAPMSGPFVLTVADDGTVQGFVEDGPMAVVEGRTAAQVGAALEGVTPDPAVAPHADLPASERYDAAYVPEE